MNMHETNSFLSVQLSELFKQSWVVSIVFIFGAAEFKERWFQRLKSEPWRTINKLSKLHLRTYSCCFRRWLVTRCYVPQMTSSACRVEMRISTNVVIAFSYFAETKSFSCSWLNVIMILPLTPTRLPMKENNKQETKTRTHENNIFQLLQPCA